MITLPKDDEKLLEECRIETMRSQGKGGQHVNKTDSKVRLTHLKTGIVVGSSEHRSQLKNKKECLKKLRELVSRLNYRKPKRVKTKPPKSALEQKKKGKKIHSTKKSLRKNPTLDD